MEIQLIGKKKKKKKKKRKKKKKKKKKPKIKKKKKKKKTTHEIQNYSKNCAKSNWKIQTLRKRKPNL